MMPVMPTSLCYRYALGVQLVKCYTGLLVTVPVQHVDDTIQNVAKYYEPLSFCPLVLFGLLVYCIHTDSKNPAYFRIKALGFA